MADSVKASAGGVAFPRKRHGHAARAITLRDDTLSAADPGIGRASDRPRGGTQITRIGAAPGGRWAFWAVTGRRVTVVGCCRPGSAGIVIVMSLPVLLLYCAG